MKPLINQLFQNKFTVVLILIIILLLIGGFFAYQKFVVGKSSGQAVEEVDLPFDPEGPYAILYPRRDGNALVLNIKRTASYDMIRYDITYNSEGIDRGASGEISTKEKRGEYEQEILFGTCSTGGKCVYDKGVENGTLTLHIRKGKEAYRMITQWHLQKPEIALGILSSGDSHFNYQIDPKLTNLSLIQYTIINDLSGAPKLPAGKIISGKVYSLQSSIAKIIPGGFVVIELADNPTADAKIARYDEAKNDWILYDTKIDGNKLTALVDSGGIFTVFTPQEH